MSKPWLYAIAEPDGSPHMTESCVCQDRGYIAEQVSAMNDELDPGDPKFKVVALYRRKSKRRVHVDSNGSGA